jgi:hypothetical protein
VFKWDFHVIELRAGDVIEGKECCVCGKTIQYRMSGHSPLRLEGLRALPRPMRRLSADRNGREAASGVGGGVVGRCALLQLLFHSCSYHCISGNMLTTRHGLAACRWAVSANHSKSRTSS